MSLRAVAALMISAAVVAGCASPLPDPSETVLAAPCCATLQEFPFYNIPSPTFEEDIEITPESPVAVFNDGASPFQAFKLPQHMGKLKIRISTILEGQVFIPYVMVLDNQMNLLNYYSGDRSALRYGTVIKHVYRDLEMTLETNPANPKAAGYLVIHTSPREIGKSTTFKSAERLRSEEQGYAPPIAPDPTVVHGYFGTLEVEMQATSFGASPVSPLVAATPVAVAVSQPSSPVVATSPSQALQQAVSAVPDSSAAVVAAPVVAAAVTTAPGTMMAETEAMYNQMITQAVAGRDIDKAMKLVEEAERAGSASARKTFVEEVKKLK